MKKLVLLTSLVLATNSFASIKTYKELAHSVVIGDHIRIGLMMKNCTINDSPVQNPMFKFGYFSPNEIIMTNGDTLVASLNHFTKNDLRAAGRPAYQYVTYTFTPDNNVRVTMDLLDAVSYASLVPKEVYDCKLGKGVYVI